MDKLFNITPNPKAKRIYQALKKVMPYNNRRYKLHQKIKNICDLRTKQRMIIVHYDYQIENKYIVELQTKFQYNIQSEMFTANEIEVVEPEFLTN